MNTRDMKTEYRKDYTDFSQECIYDQYRLYDGHTYMTHYCRHSVRNVYPVGKNQVVIMHGIKFYLNWTFYYFQVENVSDAPLKPFTEDITRWGNHIIKCKYDKKLG